MVIHYICIFPHANKHFHQHSTFLYHVLNLWLIAHPLTFWVLQCGLSNKQRNVWKTKINLIRSFTFCLFFSLSQKSKEGQEALFSCLFSLWQKYEHSIYPLLFSTTFFSFPFLPFPSLDSKPKITSNKLPSFHFFFCFLFFLPMPLSFLPLPRQAEDYSL